MTPGITDTAVLDVSIVGAEGRSLAVDYGPLLDTLGLRVGSRLRPHRRFNPFRLAEDRRRVRAHAHLAGYFEAKVAEPEVVRTDDGVRVKWTVREGPKYRYGSVTIVDAPDGFEPMLREMIPFGAGDSIAVIKARPRRRELAEKLQAHGYGHARVYSRAWLDRDAKTAAWYYFVDAGPKTTIGSIEVLGNVRVPADIIERRSGLRVGGEYSTRAKKRAELALLDSGSIRSVVVRHDADILTGPPQWPDTGGTALVDNDGNMAERPLESKINVRLVVVEAPAREFRIEAGAEADRARIDAFARSRVFFRDLLSAGNHVVLEGSVGYGWEVGTTDDPTGVYGSALAQIIRAGSVGSFADLLLSGRFRQELFPGASVRTFSAGPGLRSVPRDNLFFNLEVLAARSEAIDFGPFDPAMEGDLSLSADPVFAGGLAKTSLIYDVRNDRVEALRGHLLAASAELAPGGPLASHRYLRLGGDVRKMFPVRESLSVATRLKADWVFLETDDGVPLGARLFGGGAYGFRGFGRQRLSPTIGEDEVGGLSLAETSLEARYLPFRGLYGAVAFADFGGASANANPFDDGLSAALGLGARARTFWIPISIDVAYRLLEDSEFLGPGALDRWSLFFRMGEAF